MNAGLIKRNMTRSKALLIKKPSDIRPSEITSHDNYLNRREFIRASAIAGATWLAAGFALPRFTRRSIFPVLERCWPLVDQKQGLMRNTS